MSRQMSPRKAGVCMEKMTPQQLVKADAIWFRTVDKAILNEETGLKSLEEHVQEIDETLASLETLHEKVKHDVMVPFGRVAMFPGHLIHTNEVHVRMSSNFTVHTSTKHAREILLRRRDFVEEQRYLVQQQLDSLKSRRLFSHSAGAHDTAGVREIIEVYDEVEHGELHMPMVRDAVHKERTYHGPPRSEAEQAAEAATMKALEQFVAQANQDRQHQDTYIPDAPLEIGQCQDAAGQATLVHDGLPKEVATQLDQQTDSDDDDRTELDYNMETTVDEDTALALELERLVAAFEGTGEPAIEHDSSAKEVAVAAHQPQPLIMEMDEAEATAGATGSTSIGPGNSASSGERTEHLQKCGSTASKPQATRESRSGLKQGFLNRASKPTKGILKKPTPPADANYHGIRSHGQGPVISRSLAEKQEPLPSELTAFSGVVVERAAAEAAGQARMDEGVQASSSQKKMSKFKSRMAAGNR